MHYTAMDPADAAFQRLCDPVAEVSAHYLIDKDGRVRQLVDETMRAWHAGPGGWGNVSDVNSRSIGIELDNTGFEPFSEPLMRSLEALMPGILRRWAIPVERVIAHSDMAPDRKIDPGLRFDWRRLARKGLTIWPEEGTQPGDFYEDAARFGYTSTRDRDDHEALTLKAFRLRFRPWARGPLDETDRALMADLAQRFPVDQGFRFS